MSEEGFNKAYPNSPGRALRQAIRIARGEIKPGTSTADIVDALKDVYSIDNVVRFFNRDNALSTVIKRAAK